MTAAILTDWRDVSALGAFGLIYGIACGFIGYRIGQHREHNRWARIRPTPEQRCFSDSMRFDRMNAEFDRRSPVHRTDSEPLSTK